MKTWQVPGIHSVLEAIKCRPSELQFVALKTGYDKTHKLKEIAAIAKSKQIEIREWNPKKLDAITSGHQGVLAEVKAGVEPELKELFNQESALVLILDGIEDSQNLGSILRSSWLMEVDCVIVPKDRSVKLNPTAIKIASGGAEHVPVLVVNHIPSLIKDFKENGFWTAGLAEGGDKNLWDWEPHQKTLLVTGSEDKGIRKPVKAECDDILEIWQTVGGSSYNAGVATALALNEYVRKFKS
ncbi:MAG: 23S rRNA (guanosine(2251)-2'-O)-methyltransferase RlmB [Bdellovibrionales bacterium]